MSHDSSDDLFGDAVQSDSAGTCPTPFLEFSFASCVLSFFYDDQLTVHSRELSSNDEAYWRLASWPRPTSAAAFVVRPLLPFARKVPEKDLVLDSALIAALSPHSAKGVVCVGAPSGHLYLLPVDPEHLSRHVVLLGSVGQPLVEVEALRVGEKASSILVMIGRGGKAGYLYFSGDKLVFKVGLLEADISHCEVVHNVLFCACGRNQLLRANFEAFQLRTSTWRLNGEFLPQEIEGGCQFVTADGSHVSFTDLCLEPERYQLPEGPKLPLHEGIARLQSRAEDLESLREQHIALDDYLRQVNTACRLRQMDIEERKTFFEVTTAVERSRRYRYQLRLDFRNRLEGSLSPDWRIVTGFGTHQGAARVVEQPLPCRLKGSSCALVLEGAFSEAAHTGPLALTVDLVLPLDADVVDGIHSGLFSVRLLTTSLSLLDFLIPRDDQPSTVDLRGGPPGHWRGLRDLQDAFLAPLLPPASGRRLSPLSVAAVELHDGDRMPFLPHALDWMLREDASRRDYSCFDVPLALEVAFPVQSAFQAPVRRLCVRCTAPRLLLGITEALAALVVRRKSVTGEDLKQDLLLLQALCRSEDTEGEVAEQFQQLLDANALLNGLRCV